MHTKFWQKNQYKETLGRPRHRQEDSIKIDPREIG
jgi:hypothetical protein